MTLAIHSIFDSPLPMAAHEKLTRAYVDRLRRVGKQREMLEAVNDYLDRLDNDTETNSRSDEDDHVTKAIILIKGAVKFLDDEMQRVRHTGAITWE